MLPYSLYNVFARFSSARSAAQIFSLMPPRHAHILLDSRHYYIYAELLTASIDMTDTA